MVFEKIRICSSNVSKMGRGAGLPVAYDDDVEKSFLYEGAKWMRQPVLCPFNCNVFEGKAKCLVFEVTNQPSEVKNHPTVTNELTAADLPNASDDVRSFSPSLVSYNSILPSKPIRGDPLNPFRGILSTDLRIWVSEPSSARNIFLPSAGLWVRCQNEKERDDSVGQLSLRQHSWNSQMLTSNYRVRLSWLSWHRNYINVAPTTLLTAIAFRKQLLF